MLRQVFLLFAPVAGVHVLTTDGHESCYRNDGLSGTWNPTTWTMDDDGTWHPDYCTLPQKRPRTRLSRSFGAREQITRLRTDARLGGRRDWVGSAVRPTRGLRSNSWVLPARRGTLRPLPLNLAPSEVMLLNPLEVVLRKGVLRR